MDNRRMQKENLLNRWKPLILRISGQNDTSGCGAQLLNCYQEPQRFYHNTEHLINVLELLDFAKQNITIADNVADIIELALWYHDSVYDPTKHDNEEKSVELFLSHSEQLNLNKEIIDNVKRLIMVTKCHFKASGLDEEIIADCDLATLGYSPEIYNAYEVNVRKEYEGFPMSERKKFLESFIQNTPIFKTSLFRDKFEEQAIKNLKNTIAQF